MDVGNDDFDGFFYLILGPLEFPDPVVQSLVLAFQIDYLIGEFLYLGFGYGVLQLQKQIVPLVRDPFEFLFGIGCLFLPVIDLLSELIHLIHQIVDPGIQ